MIRKTLTILSLIGLLLSVGLWGVGSFYLLSYSSEDYGFGIWSHSVFILVDQQGTLIASPKGWQWQKENKKWSHFDMPQYFNPQPSRGPWGLMLPLWIPTLLFTALFLACRPLHFRRRRKLGLCIKCGYDLRGSEDICPECGTEFESSEVEGLGSSAGDSGGCSVTESGRQRP